jgi:hypothetical protein
MGEARAPCGSRHSLQKDLKSRNEALWRRNLLSRPADLHESGDAQRRIANRDLAADNRCFLEGTWSNEANTALTDVLHATRQRTDFRTLHGAEQGKFTYHDFEALGEPDFMTSIGLEGAFHVEQCVRYYQRQVNPSEELVQPA